MQIIKQKHDLQQQVKTLKFQGKSIGFVPTMGALHAGHLALVKQALQHCDVVVVSIFVNPTQFENPEDLLQYPRNLEKDVEMLSQLDDALFVFQPEASQIYGKDVNAKHFSFDGIEDQMEGQFRKGHFDGVGTVVKKFFELVQPDKAFFGEKDFQQLQIIRKLVEKLQLTVEVVGCPIEREESGLARSSRNERLSLEQRQKAARLYAVLQQAKYCFGTKSALEVKKWVKTQFEVESDLKLEYFEIANEDTLQPLHEKQRDEKYRAFIAAYSGEIRLIDNIALN